MTGQRDQLGSYCSGLAKGRGPEQWQENGGGLPNSGYAYGRIWGSFVW